MAKRVIGIIVAYKNSERIKKLATSVSKTTINRVIIVNNYFASKAELQTIIRGKNIDLINNGNNEGFAKAVNLGITKAKEHNPTHIILLNPDLSFTKDEMETLLNSEGDIVGPVLKFKRDNKWVYDYGGKVNLLLGRPIHEESSTILNTDVPAIDFISGACMLIKSEVVNRVGLFDERFFMYFEDVDFCLRAKKVGFDIKVNPEAIFSHDIEEHRFTQNAAKLSYVLKSNWQFVQKWIPLYAKPISYCYLALLALKIRLAA